MKRSGTAMHHPSPDRSKGFFCRILSHFPFLPDGAVRWLAPDLYRARKERWEFEWQAREWAGLYREPRTKEKVLEYWNTFRFLSEIRNRVLLDENTLVLDVGCGISTVLEYIPGKRYGIDPLADLYRTIHEYPPDLEIRKGYAEALPYPDHHFDVVFCSNAIDHTEHPNQAIGEIFRVMKPRGYLILTCEVFSSDTGRRNIGHPHTMTLDALLELVKDFEMIEHWKSPWIGLLNYTRGESPTDQEEHILLLRKPRSSSR